ncbi:hypothetical protein LGK95_08360 [Clostridium algoriphilum]|uniref:hypothetical protein n=1 Tax=Clostridium algoriphilum TaxID=198347 RepID=UPI001CF1589F|nr:hypothetical protein [Clostridium algoriphilum]MCB2293532.1 hypothetical protein [Clostridium algoriphilum]
MKKQVIRFLVTGLVAVSISAPVFATWYQDIVTIPEKGMTTTARTSTSRFNYTQVQRNVYNVYSRIDSSAGVAWSSFVLNPAGDPLVRTHTTDSAGKLIKAEFKAEYNQIRPTDGLIRWQP